MKLLNDLKLQFEKELWALNPELAVMDTILNDHPEIIDIVREEITGERQCIRQERDQLARLIRVCV
ncbi:MAG: hypothetical protein M0Z52_09665 [Actinomycetota bacterium]|nr:hypothetical protein [Actinomycetota bacterium]